MSCAKSQVNMAEGKCKGMSKSMKSYKDQDTDNNSMSKMESKHRQSNQSARMGGY